MSDQERTLAEVLAEAADHDHVRSIAQCRACAAIAEAITLEAVQQKRITELELYRTEHERLKQELNEILHPNGDGPKAPAFCDLVAYVRADLAAREERIAELETALDASMGFGARGSAQVRMGRFRMPEPEVTCPHLCPDSEPCSRTDSHGDEGPHTCECVEPEVTCDCEYPHGNDFDPYQYEQCTCVAGCDHCRK